MDHPFQWGIVATKTIPKTCRLLCEMVEKVLHLKCALWSTKYSSCCSHRCLVSDYFLFMELCARAFPSIHSLSQLNSSRLLWLAKRSLTLSAGKEFAKNFHSDFSLWRSSACNAEKQFLCKVLYWLKSMIAKLMRRHCQHKIIGINLDLKKNANLLIYKVIYQRKKNYEAFKIQINKQKWEKNESHSPFFGINDFSSNTALSSQAHACIFR